MAFVLGAMTIIQIIMRNEQKQVLFVASYWDAVGHVGMLRAGRMVRWLTEEGYRITIIRAGESNRSEKTAFGEVITIADPLRMHAEPDALGVRGQSARKPSRIRRWWAYALLVPDPSVVWSRRIMRDPLVLEAAAACGWFMASCPPEAGFLAASALARRFDGKFIMDMRDGWLDEPMKPLLRTAALQRWREGRLENRMLRAAASVLVSSDVWKEMLLRRYPSCAGKVHVITNAYPAESQLEETPSREMRSRETPSEERTGYAENNAVNPLIFLHSGRLFSSRPERQIETLLLPLLDHDAHRRLPATFIFAGDLIAEEELVLEYWKDRLEFHGWSVQRVARESHRNAVSRMHDADVLLLLSGSHGSIPAKFFDYIATGRPILAATLPGSALDRICRNIPQVIVCYQNQADQTAQAVSMLFDRIQRGQFPASIRPVEFEESWIKPHFLKIFQS